MTAQTPAESGRTSALQAGRRLLRLAFSLTAGVALSTAILVAAVSGGHAMTLTDWLDSRNASPGDPSYQATYDIRDDSMTYFLVSVTFIGLWVLIWAVWYRKAMRGNPSSRRLRAFGRKLVPGRGV